MPVPNFRIQAFFYLRLFSNQILNNLFVNHFNFFFLHNRKSCPALCKNEFICVVDNVIRFTLPQTRNVRTGPDGPGSFLRFRCRSSNVRTYGRQPVLQ